ncbi:MAG: hypothetical protein J5I98_21030 [Phaeodactylibacter sp.]|nr:hypothetical protein [Phaeodactylibacter sp.]
MAITQAMWIHGHSMQIEYQDRLKSVWRPGFYVRVVGKRDTTNWFHFSIPTTVIVRDKRQMIDSVMLRFRARHTRASVTNVHIYDGERRIATYDGLDLSPRNFDLSRFNVPGKPDVLWGIGISVGVRFAGTNDEQNTLEFSSAGCDFSLFQSVRLHFKVLTNPNIAIETMLDSMRQVFEPRGFRVLHLGTEDIDHPELDVVDVGGCRRGSTTDEQEELFVNRNGVGNNDIVVYFVRATNPPSNGCATYPNGRPGCVVARGATRWTLAHEIGHVLGLNHVNNNDRLMTGNGTGYITNPPPDIVNSEINTMSNSRLTVDP